MLSKLPKFQQEKIIDNMKYVNFVKDQVILKMGTLPERKIIIPVESSLKHVSTLPHIFFLN
jgi:hypothetical protein